MNENDNGPSNKEAQGLKGCLLVVAGIMGFGLLLALASKNFHEETMAILGMVFGVGILYVVVKHTEMAIQIVVFLVFIAAAGSIFSSCSKHSRPYEGPGVGFR